MAPDAAQKVVSGEPGAVIPVGRGEAVETFAVVRGRIVSYQDNYDVEPVPAIITHVWPNENGRLVNLCVFSRDGEPRPAVRVYRGASEGTWRPPGAKE